MVERKPVGRLGQPLGLERGSAVVDLSPASTLPLPVRDGAGMTGRVRIGFHLPVPQGTVYLARVHSLVESLANYLVGSALEGGNDGVAARTAAIRSSAVTRLTTLVLLRLRFQLDVTRQRATTSLLAEECLVLGYRGDPAAPEWLPDAEAFALLGATGDANIPAGQRTAWLERAISALPALESAIAERGRVRGIELRTAHERVRKTAGLTGVSYRVEPHLPVDVLGCYLIAPVVNN